MSQGSFFAPATGLDIALQKPGGAPPSNELPSISGVYNFIKANTPNAIAAKGAMLEGTADMRIAYIGDSTVFGLSLIHI